MALWRFFRHVPTQRWVPYRLDGTSVTPGSAYVPDLARTYQLPAGEIEVVELDADPLDFEGNAVPIPVVPPTPQELEIEGAKQLAMPTFAEIDALVDAVFPAPMTNAQRVYLKRLSKLVRVCAARVGLGA